MSVKVDQAHILLKNMLWQKVVIKSFAGLYTSVSSHLPLKMQAIKVLNHIPIKGRTITRDVCTRLSLEVFEEMFRKNIWRNMAVVYHLSIQDVIKKDNISSIQYFCANALSCFVKTSFHLFELQSESCFIQNT